MTMTMISCTPESGVEGIRLISKLQTGLDAINLVVISTRWSCSYLFSYTI